MRPRVPWGVVGAESKVLIGTIGTDDLARIHLPVGVPDGLELFEGMDQLGAEHLLEQPRTRLSVAMLARQGSAVLDDQVGGFLDEAHIIVNAILAHQIEGDAAMHARLAEMTIQRRLVVVLIEQIAELAEVGA